MSGESIGVGTYDIKRGHMKKTEATGLGNLLKESFGNSKDLGGGRFEASMGPLVVTVSYSGKDRLSFESNTPTQIDDATATAIVKARNTFLEAATGFNAKERAKRAKKAVTGADE